MGFAFVPLIVTFIITYLVKKVKREFHNFKQKIANGRPGAKTGAPRPLRGVTGLPFQTVKNIG